MKCSKLHQQSKKVRRYQLVSKLLPFLKAKIVPNTMLALPIQILDFGYSRWPSVSNVFSGNSFIVVSPLVILVYPKINRSIVHSVKKKTPIGNQ